MTGPNHAGARLHGFLSYLMRCTVMGEEYTVYGYDGLQVRDNIHAADLVDAFEAFHHAPRAAAVYNIGGGRASNCSMLEAIAACERIAERELDWTLAEDNRIGDHRWWISALDEFTARLPRLGHSARHRRDPRRDPRDERGALGSQGPTLETMPQPEGRPRFDLQSHSTYSDGALAPAEVVRRAADAGVELLALTDHDSVDGVDEARGAAGQVGIRLVPAVELSAVDGGSEDVHVLGYLLDVRDPVLAERVAGARSERVTRAARMADRLRELGFAVDDGVLERRRAAGKSIGRPHLAAAVVSHPDNRERLAREGLTTVDTFLPAYLIPGRPGYLPRTSPTVEEAIGWIHDAGGVAVWAHPFWDIESPATVLETLDRFRGWGVDGVECFYPTHSREQAELLAGRCAELGLLSTGSADFHGPDHGAVQPLPRVRAVRHRAEPRAAARERPSTA